MSEKINKLEKENQIKENQTKFHQIEIEKENKILNTNYNFIKQEFQKRKNQLKIKKEEFEEYKRNQINLIENRLDTVKIKESNLETRIYLNNQKEQKDDKKIQFLMEHYFE